MVSGLAYGIDIHSHRAALDNGLDTVGVLAHGLDQIYPRLHRDTAIQMTSQGGLLTEFMSRTNADKVNFVRRNRIVAGMADAPSWWNRPKGRRIDYGRHRHELPPRCVRLSRPRERPLLTRCNRLIRDSKAALLQNAQDFVEAMGWQSRSSEKQKADGIQGELFPDLCEEEQRIVDCLRQSECLQINALAVATNLPVHKLSAFLFNLEMKGVVRLLSGGMYRLA